MKASELLQVAMSRYHNSGFMCTVLYVLKRELGDAQVTLHDDVIVKISQAIDGCYTLDSYLKEVDAVYLSKSLEGVQWTSKEMYDIRVEWWESFIANLQDKGE